MKLDELLTPRPCPHCGQMRGKKYLKERHEKRGQKISAALKTSSDRIGRPRTTDYSAIVELRRMGFSLRQIADKLNCTRGTVQNALRTKYNPPNKPSEE